MIRFKTRCLISVVKKYTSDTRGNFSIMFAGAATLLLLSTGIAVDISSTHAEEQKLQDNLDTLMLAAASQEISTREEFDVYASDYINTFNLNFNTSDINFRSDDNGYLYATASSTRDSLIMGAFGYKQMRLRLNLYLP